MGHAALAGADDVRRNDYDGRGFLSDSGLAAFCRFFLKTALDQVRFMGSLLEVEALMERLARYIGLESSRSSLAPESVHVLQETCLRGEISRGDAMRVTG